MSGQLIKTCKELNECEGMGKSKYKLIVVCGVTYLVSKTMGDHGNHVYYTTYGKKFCKYEIHEEYPYLTASHFDKWSSAKFLKRAGWWPECKSLMHWLIEKEDCPKDEASRWLSLFLRTHKALKEGNQELANILAIILLRKMDIEAYNKGIEPLLEGKG